MMETKKARLIGTATLAVLALVALFGLFGCASDDAAGQPSAADGEWVVGTVVEVDGSEMLIEATSDSAGSLSGPVRVDVSALDAATVESIEAGSEIEVVYPGMVGMSEPPFISAASITVR